MCFAGKMKRDWTHFEILSGADSSASCHEEVSDNTDFLTYFIAFYFWPFFDKVQQLNFYELLEGLFTHLQYLKLPSLPRTLTRKPKVYSDLISVFFPRWPCPRPPPSFLQYLKPSGGQGYCYSILFDKMVVTRSVTPTNFLGFFYQFLVNSIPLQVVPARSRRFQIVPRCSIYV